MPLGATVARAELMTWPPGAHASTFGGNPVACAAALATIELLEEGLVENAGAHGRVPDGPHARLAGAFPQVGDVRGLGLMIGIELVRDQQTQRRRRSCATAWWRWRSSAACWCWARATARSGSARRW